MRTGRGPDQLRPVRITRSYTEMTPGSVLFEAGATRVLCTASFSDSVPAFAERANRGWLTAEYSMLPGSSPTRVPRSALSGGRTKEIQRLIGRAMRAVVDLDALVGSTIQIDADVLQADGGTRTAAITGAWIAVSDAVTAALASGRLERNPIIDQVAAVSVGVVEAQPRLDLDYQEDVGADVDCNVVMTGSGLLVEVQGTAEGEPFSRSTLDVMLNLAERGIGELLRLQREAVAG